MMSSFRLLIFGIWLSCIVITRVNAARTIPLKILDCSKALAAIANGSPTLHNSLTHVGEISYPLADNFEGGSRHLVLTREDRGTHFVETLQTRPGQVGDVASAEGSDIYNHYIDEYMSFVLNGPYDRRGWPEVFKNRLRVDAQTYKGRSLWVGVREKLPDGTPGKLTGTMSMKFAPFSHVTEKGLAVGNRRTSEGTGFLYDHFIGGHSTKDVPTLPMEGMFGGRVPQEDGITWWDDSASVESWTGWLEYKYTTEGVNLEPTTFAILKDANDDVFFDLITEMMKSLKTSLDTPDLIRRGKIINTYGDDLSARFYSKYFGLKSTGKAKMTFCCQDKEWQLLRGDVGTALGKFLKQVNEAKNLSADKKHALRQEIETMLSISPNP